MKKRYRHTELSEEKCRCGMRLKKNVVERKQVRPLNCYGCYSGMRDAGASDYEARTIAIPRNLRQTRRELIRNRKERRERLGI